MLGQRSDKISYSNISFIFFLFSQCKLIIRNIFLITLLTYLLTYFTYLAQEDVFSQKTQKVIHPQETFNNIPVVCSSCQKHLGIYFDEKYNFSNHIKEKIQKQIKV